MGAERLNDAPILDQLEGHWEKVAGLLLHKLAKRGEAVTITAADMLQMTADWPDGAIVLAMGAYDRITFKLVTRAEAERLAAHQATQHSGRQQ